MHDPAKKRARWGLRITLRVFLFVVLAVAIVLGLVLNRARQQRDAVAAIQRAGGGVTYEFEWPRGLIWQHTKPSPWKERLGIDLFYRVKAAHLGEKANSADPALLMRHVGVLRDLEVLGLSGWDAVKDEHLAPLRNLTNLQELFLTFTGASGRSLQYLEGMARLKHLELPLGVITDADIAHLSGLTSLEWLQGQGSHYEITDAGLAHLKSLVKLKTLSLLSSQVTSDGLVALGEMNQLDYLTLHDSKVTHLRLIGHLTQIKSLNLYSTPFDDAGMASLRPFEQLDFLDLENTRVTDAGLVHLAGLKSLKSLRLGGTRVSDAGLPHLAGLDNLTLLFLDGTRVTDAGLTNLQGLRSCEQVTVRDTAVTAEGLAKAQANRPQTGFFGK